MVDIIPYTSQELYVRTANFSRRYSTKVPKNILKKVL
jgi:hypothetical protein